MTTVVNQTNRMSDLTVRVEAVAGGLLEKFSAQRAMLLEDFYLEKLRVSFPYLKDPSMTSLQPSDNLFLPAAGAGEPLRIAIGQWTMPLSAFVDPPPSAVDSAAPPTDTVRFVLKPPAPAPSAGGLGKLEAMLAQMCSKMDRWEKKQRWDLLKRLLIPPDPSEATDSTLHGGITRNDERKAFKRKVIDYYGLWADSAKTMVYPMLQIDHAVPEAIPLKECVLSRIWGRSYNTNKTSETEELRRLLGLPENFHTLERNYMIHHPLHEEAHGHDALTLHPRKDAAGAESVRVKVGPAIDSFIDAAAQLNVRAYDGTLLFLPNGNKPFLRLLGWRTICAYRRWFEDKDDVDPPPFDIDFNVSTGESEGVYHELHALLPYLD